MQKARNIKMLLIIDSKTASANSLQTALSYMGILAKPVTPSNAAAELSALYRAVLIKNPENLPDWRDYVKRLLAYSSGLPFFAISDSCADTEKKFFTKIFPSSATASELALGIIKASRALGCQPIGEYILSGLDASVLRGEPEYFYSKIKLTAKENMILRFLIRAYPTPVLAQGILKYAFLSSKTPEPSAVRAHISSINKKFSGVTGGRLISSPENLGYIIMTPELCEKKSIKSSE